MPDDAARAIGRMADEVWQHQLAREPYYRLRRGLEFQHLRTGSLEEAEEHAGFARGRLKALDNLDENSLGDDDRITFAFLEAFLTEGARAPEQWWWSFPVTPYGAYGLNAVTAQVAASFRFESASDVARYLAVMADHSAAIRVAHAKLVDQARRGWRIPRPALGGAIATMCGVKDSASTVFPVDESREAGLSVAARTRLDDGVKTLLGEIASGVDAILSELDGCDASAPDDVGLAQYPGGEEAYATLVRQHATFDISPDEIHAIGLSQVAELTEEMQRVRSGLGFSGTENDFRLSLEGSGRLYASSADDVEGRYRAAIARIEPVLASLFAKTPEAPYGVERLDASMEAGMSYGYYEPPTDAMPVGRYRYNGSGLDTRSQISAAALIYHELVPGHHFHIARQNENDSLPDIRKEAISFTAFTEGWAEYGTGLADELGMYEDPYDRYGWLVHQRFAAQRLVVDTGMNALGWSLERARRYMSEMTLESPTQVATVTLRYSTDLPAQAIAYRLGFLKFRELRDRMRGALGGGFDIRDFHELILAPGALPLRLVERNVEHALAHQAK